MNPYLQAIDPHQMIWDYIQQRCQAAIPLRGNQYGLEILWDENSNVPIVQRYSQPHTYYYVMRQDGRTPTLRDCFQALGIINAQYNLIPPWNERLNIDNVLDTSVSNVPLCQIDIVEENNPDPIPDDPVN